MNMSNKAIFLDCDGTLIEDPGYINDPEQVKLLEGVPEGLIELRAMGYKLIVVSNQSGVARGFVTEQVLGEIHNRLRQLLSEKGAHLDEIYYCPYHPEGVVRKYRKESDWRKPNPGMLQAAAEEMDIDLGQSWCIGDSSRDVEAGLRVGCKTILVNRLALYKTSYDGPAEPTPDYKSVNMKEAVNIVKQYHRSSNNVKAKAKSASKPEAKPAPESKSKPEPEPKSKPEPVSKPKPIQESKTKPVPESKPKPATKAKAKPVPEAVEQLKTQEAKPVEQDVPVESEQQLLNSILDQLRGMQRANLFSEFSIMRLLAGILQIIVPFCLLITVWLLMRPNRQDSSVLISLGFAMVLQMMSLTLYIMHGRK